MKTSKISIPRPPYCGKHTHSLIQEGVGVCYAWYFDEAGRKSIETLYETARSLQTTHGWKRATAYRFIAKHPKRYWIIDYTDPKEPSCVCGIPREAIKDYTPSGAGNPNFTNGIYQQEIARKRRQLRRVDNLTN